jgi:hypothetical protein
MNRKSEGKQTYLSANTFLLAWYIEKLICSTDSNNVTVFKKRRKKKKREEDMKNHNTYLRGITPNT